MERSAEWLRGAIEALNRAQRDFTVTVPELQAEYVALLAAAEDREASQPTATEVIAAVEKAMQRTADHICDSSPYEVCIKNCPECLRQNALAIIDHWKEANGGK